MLVQRSTVFPARGPSSMAANIKTRTYGNTVQEAAVFSGVNRRLESQAFEGGKLDAVCGSIELDLRGALISREHGRAVLESNAIFGGITITVRRPGGPGQRWGRFGAYEDKTVPPRPDAGIDASVLELTGGAVFGAVTIQN